MQDQEYCSENRLLQRPVVVLKRMDELDDSNDLLPAADLIETAEMFDCDNDDSTLGFFQPNIFANNQTEDDPLSDVGDVVNGVRPPSPPSFRFTASVVHGMATKHLDQMVENMPSPATSFSTELDDEELEDVMAVTVIPDSHESSVGTE